MDFVYASEAAQILGVSRATIQRMADSKRLPPDGLSDSGARYWLRSTILSHLSGKPSRIRFIFVQQACIDSLKAPEQRFKGLVTGKVEPLSLTSTTPGQCLIDACSAIADMEGPAALGIGMSFSQNPFFVPLAIYAQEQGVTLILVPNN